MNLISRIKQGATLVLAAALTVVMFPVVLATTTFLLITGFIAALFGAYKIRQLAKDAERTGAFNTSQGKGSDRVTIEGSYYVVRPVS